MAWIKKRYQTASGWRHAVGYRDEAGVQRSRGGFTSKKSAQTWADAVDDATAGGKSELADFLGRSFEAPSTELSLDEVFSMFFARDLAPEKGAGVAPATVDNYLRSWNKHVSPRAGGYAASDFSRPAACSRLFGQLREAGCSERTVANVRAILSSTLSWATEQELVSANGVGLVQRRRRRSTRKGRRQPRADAPSSPRTVRQGRALSPRAVALVHAAQLADPGRPKDPLRPLRDGTATLSQYLLGCRNQELWGLRWESVSRSTTSIVEVVSFGELDEGKTEGSNRTLPTPPLLVEVLDRWRQALVEAERAPAPSDFIFPGVHPAGHMTLDQARQWPRQFLRPVVKSLGGEPPEKLAGQARFADPDPSFAYLTEAVQYSLRRGHMSVRLRAGDDSVRIARDCGTSVEMLFRNYADDIAEVGSADRRSVNDQLRESLGWNGDDAASARRLALA